MGVSDRLDLGAYYTRNPNANYGWVGVEAKYGLMRQSETMPISLAVRGAYTKTLYVDDMDMHAITVDIGAGRTFWNALTPYLDVGGDLVLARETSAAVDLRRETLLVSQLVGGVEYRLWHVALGAEANVAALTTFQLKVVGLF